MPSVVKAIPNGELFTINSSCRFCSSIIRALRSSSVMSRTIPCATIALLFSSTIVLALMCTRLIAPVFVRMLTLKLVMLPFFNKPLKASATSSCSSGKTKAGKNTGSLVGSYSSKATAASFILSTWPSTSITT